MSGNVLCPIDDSEGIGKAEKEAAKICRLTGMRLILLYVMEKWSDASMVATDSQGWKRVLDDWMAEGRGVLERKEELLRAEGVTSIKKELRNGEKAYEIISIAIEQNVHLIVMPKYRSWSIRKLMSSSLVSKLIEHSPCPIMWVNY